MFPFVAVGRVKDGVLLVHHGAMDSDEQHEQSVDLFRKLMVKAPARLSAGQRTRLQSSSGSAWFLMDQRGELLCCVVTSCLDYPEHSALDFLHELLLAVSHEPDLDICQEGALDERLGPEIQQMVLTYERKTEPLQTWALSSFVSHSIAAQSMVQSRPSALEAMRGTCNWCFLLVVSMLVLIICVLSYFLIVLTSGACAEAAAKAAAKAHAAAQLTGKRATAVSKVMIATI